MSLLRICRAVFAETGWPVLGSIASNSNATAQQAFALANSELAALSELYDWPHLEEEFNFTTIPGQAWYAFPADFRKVSVGSVFDKSEYYQIKGSLSITHWFAQKYALLGNLSRMKFRVKYVNGVAGFEVTPTPESANDMVALYYGTNYALTGDIPPVPKEYYELDTDVSRIPERLIMLGLRWRFRRAKGLDFSAELAEYNLTVGQQFGARIASADIKVGGRMYESWADCDGLTNGYIPENGFGI